MKLSRKCTKQNETLINFLNGKVLLLADQVPKIIEAQEISMGEQYQYIFTEYGRLNLPGIIEDSSTKIPALLLDLMSIGTVRLDDLTSTDSERIKARNQLGFWKEFLRMLQKLEPAKKF